MFSPELMKFLIGYSINGHCEEKSEEKYENANYEFRFANLASMVTVPIDIKM